MAAYFEQLNYALGDEDARVEQELVPDDARHVVAIAGAGNRLIPLLARAPDRLRLFDIQAKQIALTELRLAALRDLEREEFIGLLGFDESMSPEGRRSLFKRLTLSEEARRYLKRLFEAEGFGPIVYMGRFERMLGQLAAVSALYAGRGARHILEMTTLDEQLSYYHQAFPKRRWKQIVFLMGNSAVLNALLYRGEFPRKNLPESAYAIYTRIFERLFTRMLARSSFFLQMVLVGRLRFPEGWPAECDPGVYAAAKEAVRRTRVELVHGDVFGALAAGDAPADLVALSDVPSFLPPGQDQGFLQAVHRGVRQGGRVITRGHLRVPKPVVDGYDDISEAHATLLASERTQLWQIHVYART